MKRIATGCICLVMLSASDRLPDVVRAPASDAYQGQPLTLVVGEKVSFIATTSGRAAFALFGAFAMISAGEKIVKENDIADPSAAIADKLGADTARRFKTLAPTTVSDFGDSSNKQIAKAAGNKGLAVYVEPVGWGFRYFSLKWGSYQVHYSMRARLLDANTGTVLAQSPCQYVSNDEDHAPDYDTMMADHAAFVKTAMASAAGICAAELAQKMLGDVPAP